MGEKITTVKQLEEAFPELVKQIREETMKLAFEEIAAAPVEVTEKKFPTLVKKLKEKIENEIKTVPASLKIDGFLLEIKDPFAAPVARYYAAVAATAVPQLPMVLPYENKGATIAALKNYLLRAQGAGDAVRARAAADALVKLGFDVKSKK